MWCAILCATPSPWAKQRSSCTWSMLTSAALRLRDAPALLSCPPALARRTDSLYKQLVDIESDNNDTNEARAR